MSQSTASLPARIIRNDPGQLPQLGGAGPALIAPGVVAQPPSTSGVRLLGEALRSISEIGQTAAAIGQTAGTLDSISRRNAADIKRAEEEARILQEHADTVDRGRAHAFAREQIQPILSDIETGKRARPAGMTTIEFAKQIADELTPADSSPAFASALRDAISEPVQKTSIARDTMILANSRQDLATNVRDALSSANTPEDASQIIQRSRGMFSSLSDTEFANLITIPALNAAAKAADVGRVDAISNAIAGNHDHFSAERATARSVLQQVQTAQANRDSKVATDNVYNMQLAGAAPADILVALQNPLIDPKTANEIRKSTISTAQKSNADDVLLGAARGEIPADQVQAILTQRASLPTDNLYHVDAGDIETIVNKARALQKVNESETKVRAVLGGTPGVLTDEDNTAFVRVLSSAGILDKTGNIADGSKLGTAVLRAGIMPKAIAETIVGNLQSNQPTSVQQSITTIGRVSNNPRLWASLLESAPETVRPAIINAKALSVKQADAGAVTSVRQTLAAANEPKKIPDDIANAMFPGVQNPTLNLDAKIIDIVSNVRESYPFTKNYTLLGTDWGWPDPSLSPPGQDTIGVMRQWYSDAFRETQGLNLSASQREAEISARVQGQIRNQVDFVRWDGNISPVLIRNNAGIQLPDSLRWGADTENDAKAFLKLHKNDPADILSIVPELSPLSAPGQSGAEAAGWKFYKKSGPLAIATPVTDAKGIPLVFRPTSEAQKKAAEYQQVIDRKMAEYQTPLAYGSDNFADLGSQDSTMREHTKKLTNP